MQSSCVARWGISVGDRVSEYCILSWCDIIQSQQASSPNADNVSHLISHFSHSQCTQQYHWLDALGINSGTLCVLGHVNYSTTPLIFIEIHQLTHWQSNGRQDGRLSRTSGTPVTCRDKWPVTVRGNCTASLEFLDQVLNGTDSEIWYTRWHH